MPFAAAAFTDVSAQMGISYRHSLKSDNANAHGGAAVVDVNGDGYSDLLFARYQKAPLLYVNDGTGAFSEESAARRLSLAQDASAFGAADFDNDGDQDIYMTTHEGNRFYLFINDGTGQFSEEAVSRGADLTVADTPHKGFSVGLVDYDLDGYLDISISEWSVTLDSEFAEHSALLHNRGAEAPGHFELATEASGLLQPVSSDTQHGFSSAWADFDGDSWPDLALIVDYGKSQMYWNDGDGSFTRDTESAGVGFDENGMGVAVADYDGDGLLDFFVTSIYDEFSNQRDGSATGNKLYRNMGNRNFQEVAVPSGVSRTGWGWGTAFFDYDNDADFDLVATNGWPLAEGADPKTTPFAAAGEDATTLFLNNADGTFDKAPSGARISDNRYGKALLVLDWDSDGDEDLVVVNSFSDPVFYENDAASKSNDWIRLKLEGTVSNRDAIGTVVRVVEDGHASLLNYNPSNSFIGQREGYLHFGLGESDGVVDRIEVRWPTGVEEVFDSVSANQILTLVEPADAPVPPLISKQPEANESYEFGEELVLEVEAIGSPDPIFIWEKDGVVIEGESDSRLHLKRLAPYDAGVYRAKAVNAGGGTYSREVDVTLSIDLEEQSIARWWNELTLEAIRKDFPDPTKHSRNLYHVSAAMWDAYWAYEEEAWTRAQPVFHQEDLAESDFSGNRISAQSEAISHAAYTVLVERYRLTPGAERSLFGFRWLMESSGYDSDNDSIEGNDPAAVGNRIGQAVLSANLSDGSNEENGYLDTSGYFSVNQPLVLELPGAGVDDLNRWQPLAFDFAISQNGIPLGALVQSFLGVNWREVGTFAMAKTSHNTIGFDPGPPPLWATETHQAYVDAALEVIRYSSALDPANDELIDISPGALLNNSLGRNDGVGRLVNPVTGEAYPENKVKLADYGRILAEFWADGPASETPPGHWNTIHNEISDSPNFQRKYMGKGEELDKLQWDIRAYLALNGGLHDAAVAAWTLKAQYDYARPISMIRGLAELGQASDPSLPTYNELGLPLEAGLVEMVTAESSAPGERHEHLAESIGKIALWAWAGEPSDSHSQVGGVAWILAENWFPYQRGTFVTPAFAGYVSGHSTFSRTAAEIMTLLTGSPYFPGGLAEFHFPQGEFLEFEYGPSEDVTLQWATYYDAADQAGLSRLYGGIHVRADDLIGRTLGARVGVEAFLREHQQRNGNQENTGLLAELSYGERLGGGESSPLFQFVSEGEALQRKVYFGGTAVTEEEGIALILPPDPGSSPEEEGHLMVVARGDLKGARVQARLAEGDVLSLGIEAFGEDPNLINAYARNPLEKESVGDLELRMYRLTETGNDLVASSQTQRDNEWRSLAEVLLLRSRMELEVEPDDAFLRAALEKGSYHLEVVNKGPDVLLELDLRSLGWRPLDNPE
ncbi:FG-GAP-like repeat-containing protein [Pelagicoccus albus]|uniref:VCBS repeat-containing protein n=1 Tax=Pelagicoccus albus TaxID=415222 RepID=A0A7X1B6Y1_9BACT|nr:FG-GAP-like repeat-containing protein [Pelagicoccus albus]MBC2606791.1 VCBS repeat-containing protein [Pelagicoccus albus]